MTKGSFLVKGLASSFRRTMGVLVVLFAISACSADQNFRRVSDPVTSISVGEPGEVSANSLARAMNRAGFTRAEILELGPGIRRSLATNGGAQARREGRVLALFSYMQGRLYVTGANSGTFVMDA